jgi:hypothetical protein
MAADPNASEQVALGIALGALASVAQLPLGRLRARLALDGRHTLAFATYPLGGVVLLATLAAAISVAPLAAWAFLVGSLGMRTLVLGPPHNAP